MRLRTMFSALLILLLMALPAASSSEKEAYSLLYQARSAGQQLDEIGLSLPAVLDLVTEAELRLDAGSFSLSAEYSRQAIELAELALNTSSTIESNGVLLDMLRRLGLNVTQEAELNQRSAPLLAYGNLEQAKSLSEEARIGLEKKLGAWKEDCLITLSGLAGTVADLGIATQVIDDLRDRMLDQETDAADLLVINHDLERMDAAVRCLKEQSSEVGNLRGLIETPLLESMLSEASARLELRDYDEAISLCEGLAERTREAFRAYQELFRLNVDIAKARQRHVSVEQPKKMADLAGQDLNRNRFPQALDTIGRASYQLEQQVADDMLLNVMSKSQLSFSFIAFIKSSWKTILILLLVVAILVLLFGQRTVLWLRQRRYSGLKRHRKVIHDLMKQAQVDYFMTKRITRDSYESRMEGYQARMISVREALAALRRKGLSAESRHDTSIEGKKHALLNHDSDNATKRYEQEKKDLN